MTRDTLARLRGPLTVGAVWLAYALALAASFQHVRRAFGALEPSGAMLTGLSAAAAVEVGLAALALALVSRRRAGVRDGRLWAGLGAMALVSALANADAALTAIGGARPLWAAGLTVDPLDVVRAVVGAATLPALVLFLAAAAETLTGDGLTGTVDAAPIAPPAPLPGSPRSAALRAAAIAAPRVTVQGAPSRPIRRPSTSSQGSALEDAAAAPLTRRSADTLNAVLDVLRLQPNAPRAAIAAAVGVSADTVRRSIARGEALGVLTRDPSGGLVPGERVSATVGRPPYRRAGGLEAPPDDAAGPLAAPPAG